MKIGIALVAYNRHDTFIKVLNAVISQKISKISIYIDGPANNSIKNNQYRILKTIENFKKEIKINVIRKSKNYGLALSITNAITNELKNNEAVILLEDDCVPQKGFFNYMKKSLKKYRKNKNVRSICSYTNLKKKSNSHSFFLRRFNPWGWATWKDRWKEYDIEIKNEIQRLGSFGEIYNLPLDLKSYCKNISIMNNQEDIWSLSWTLLHYRTNTLVLYPPNTLVKNIGFDGTGVHCTKTKVFNTNIAKESKKILYPSKVNFNLIFETKNNNFLIENSSKVFFKNKLGTTGPLSLIKKNNYIALDDLNFFLEKFIYSTKVVDIHTHLFPSKYKKYHKIGLMELLNYHYLVAEFLSKTNFDPNKFYRLNSLSKSNLIWYHLFLKQPPLSTASLGVVKILRAYGIKDTSITFEKLYKIFKNIKISEDEIFYLSNVEKVVMTNNPFDLNEFKILEDNRDLRYVPSIRIDDIFNNKINLKKISNYYNIKLIDKKNYLFNFFESIIKKHSPAYFALSTENLNEINYKNELEQILILLKKYHIPMMLLIGVKRKVNASYQLAGDGIGTFNFNKLENLLNKYPHNKFLVTCLNETDQFKLTVLARKFQNLKIFGFWWFNNQKSIVTNLLKTRIELLGDNFILQHSDARVADQLIYKWNDFRAIYTNVLHEKFKELIVSGFKIKSENLEKYIYQQLNQSPDNYT